MRLDSIKQAEGIIEQPSPGRKWVTTILKTAVSVGLLIFLFSKVDLVRVGESFRHVHPGVFFLSALAYLVLQSVNIFRWLVMIRVLGYRQGFGRLSTFYFTGYFFNLFLPTSIGGDIGRCYYLAENPRDIPRAFTTILADRASGMVALMCIGTFALLIGPEVRIPDSMAWVTMGGTAALLAGVVLPFLFPRFFRRFTVPFRYWEKPVSLGAALILSFIIQ
ncbi:MAG TPA: lysylphosphatidylglycerol synthase transmembrane domain-containing protein, partial [Nitrospiria bacterium]|nr:lysylphosphatidylglycerol synthase transmembrane domain-containing protein [Nitrospiria bacterium]